MGSIDVLINNAGIGTGALVAEGFGPDERAVLDVNLSGAWRVTAHALPHLIATRGHVINIASLLAVVSMPYASAYAASKRALCGLSDTLRMEHRGVVAVTTVYPGYAKTPIHGPAERRSGRTLEGLSPEETPEDVARAVESALRRRPRDQTTTLYGGAVLRIARVAPTLVDFIVAQRIPDASLRQTAPPDRFPS